MEDKKAPPADQAEICFFPSMKPVPPNLAQSVEEYLRQLEEGRFDNVARRI